MRHLLVGVAVLLAVVAVWVWWLVGRDAGTEGAAPPTPTALSTERATELSGQLSSGDETELRQALLLPPDQPLDPGLVPGLQGLTFEFDVPTFELTGPDTATVRARVTQADGTSGTWVVDLFHTETEWQIVATTPEEQS